MKILISRPDRIGDVVLSTPVFEAIRKKYPDAQITVLVQKQVAPILSGLPEIREVLIYEPHGKHRGYAGWRTLRDELKGRDFDVVVALQSEKRIAWAIRAAGIPRRIGPLGKWHSFFCYNEGIRQHRSEVKFHETDYNLQLLRPLGVDEKPGQLATRISISEGAKARALQWLRSQGWSDSSQAPSRVWWVAIHPGMGGSALNWPLAHYSKLIAGLKKESVEVVVTCGPMPMDRKRVGKLQNEFPDLRVWQAEAQAPVDELAALFSFMGAVVAPSTGPLHLAVASGVPVVSFYPPIEVQSVRRWGPYLPESKRDFSAVFTPEVQCGQKFHCLGERCAHFPCMEKVSPERVLEALRRHRDHS